MGHRTLEFKSIVKKLIIRYIYRLLVLFGYWVLVACLAVNAQTGPGGVGNSTSNRLWLDAVRGVYLDAGITPAVDGDRVRQWNDFSGNGNNAIQGAVGNRPFYQTGVVNGWPAIRFTGNSFIDPAALGISGTEGFSIITVFKVDPGYDPGGISDGEGDYIIDRAILSNNLTSLKIVTGNKYCFQKRDNNNNGIGSSLVSTSLVSTAPFTVINYMRELPRAFYRLFVNGSLERSQADGDGNLTPPPPRIGRHYDSNNGGLEGYIAELFVYNYRINNAQVNIVNSYLAAKYNLTISAAANKYAFRSTHKYEVAGIGREDGANFHNDATSGGILNISAPSDLNDYEYLLFGHENGLITEWSPNEAPNQYLKLGREWKVDKTGEPGSVTIKFDISSLQSPPCDKFVLLRDPDGDFTDATVTALTFVSGTTYQVSGISLDDGEHLTIGMHRPPVAGITPDPANVCVGGTLNMDGHPTFGTGVYVNHAWTGSTSPLSATNIPNPVFSTSSAGSYNLTYTVTDANGCSGSDNITVLVAPQPGGPVLNAKNPNVGTVCAGQAVSATFTPGSGGTGCSDIYQYRFDGTGGWTPYTPGTNLNTTGHTQVEIQGQRSGCTAGAGCTGTAWATLATWSVNPQPTGPALLARTPDLAAVCAGQAVSATFTPGSGGTGCSDIYQYRFDGAGGWTPYTPGTNLNTTGHTQVEIQGQRSGCTAGAGCTGTAWATLATWSVNPQPTGPALLARTPDLAAVCAGQAVSATFTPGSGGTGCSDIYQYRFDGAGGWTPYTPGTNLNTTGHTQVEIQGQRSGCTAGAGCTGTAWATLATWSVNPQPTGPALLARTPDLAAVCAGQAVSATFTPGSGGTGCSDIYQYRFDGTGGWTPYTPGTNLNTTGHTQVEIQGQRSGCTAGAGCTGTAWATLATWSVNPQPTGPALLARTPDLAAVCAGQAVSATFTPGSGGTGCSDIYQYRFDGAGGWTPYTPGTNLNTTGHTQVEIQGQRSGCTAGAGCTGTAWATLATWSVNPQPTGPALLARTPDLAAVCAGQAVSATFTPGSGGTGCSDIYQYRFDGAGGWTPYTPGTNLNTTGHTQVEIQGQRSGCTAGAGCTGTAWATLATWSVNPQPTGPALLARTPDLAAVCAGQAVSATFTPGSGGTGCSDIYQYRFDGAGGWTPYTPGTNLNTTGHTQVEIQGQRSGCTAGAGCTGTAWATLATWSVNPQPTGPALLARTPDLAAVCAGQAVSATFTPGSGGTGCSDSYQYRFDGAGGWTPYTPGTNLNTTGHTQVEIQGQRSGCTAGAGCTGTAWATLATWSVNPQPTGPALLARTPDLAAVCAGQAVSATFTPGSGGTGCSDIYQYRFDGAGGWTPYTPGTNLNTTGHTQVEIQGQRSGCTAGAGCTGTAWATLATWSVNPQPTGPALLARTPDLAAVCAGQAVSATFTPGSGGTGCSDIYQYRFDGAGGWTPYTPGTNLNTTGHTQVEIQGQRSGCTAGAGCTGTAWATLATWSVNPQPTGPALLARTPDLAAVCAGQAVSATFTPGSGGTGCSDIYQYRFDGAGGWTPYTPGTNLNTTGHTQVEIQGQRSGCTAGAGCTGTAWATLATWSVNPQPTGPALLARTPDLAAVCAGQAVSATFTPGSGGTGCSDIYQYRFDGAGGWTPYTPGTNLNTTGHTQVEIQGQRSGCTAGAGCTGTAWATLATWSVNPQPTGPALLARTPDLAAVCAGQAVSATFTPGSGGTGCSDIYQYRFDGTGGWTPYTPGTNLNTTGHTQVEIQGQRSGCTAGAGCTGTAWATLATWSVNPQPTGPALLARTPDLAAVCAGQAVSATFTPGSGGTGCSDIYQYRFDGAGGWTPYTPGTNLNTTGHTQVEIQGQRSGCTAGAGCTGTAWATLATWSVNPQPTGPALLARTPDLAAVCAGQAVSATFTPGSGGTGCSDIYQYRFDGAGGWTPYTPGTNLNTTGHTQVEIQGQRSGCTAGAGCTGTAWATLATWSVNPQPTGPALLARTPDLAAVCAGQAVSATFTPGSGGTGCSDIYQYRFDGAGGWTPYTPGTNLNTTGHTQVEIQGQRSGCTAGAGCTGTAWATLATWSVNPQPTGPALLARTPDLAAVCAGQAVSATFTPGSGGTGCSDIYQYRFDGAGGWTPYTPGTNLNTTGHTQVEIQGQRSGCTAGAGCTGTAWATLATWSVNPQPTGPALLARTPDLAAVCAGQAVSATFTPGSGGTGCSDSYQYRFDGAGGWTPYTPGTNLNTTGHTQVEIQGQRSGCTAGAGCTGTAWATLATWSVNPQPTGPALLARTPDLAAVCAGQAVSATFTPGSGGTGCSDIYQYRFDGAGGWTPYTPGTNLNTTGHTQVEIQGQRSGCTAGAGCTGTAWATLATWSVNPQPTGPALLARTPDLAAVCAGQAVSATFTPGSGGTGCSDIYQYRFDGAGGWTPYTPGTNLNTTGHTQVEIQGQRSGCTAGAGCTGTEWETLAAWIVNQFPELTSTLTPPGMCSGMQFDYSPLSGIAGTTFAWSRAVVAGITPAIPASGTGNPQEVLTNTTPDPLTVRYVYSLTANGCTNSVTYNVDVVVYPVAVITSGNTANWCNNMSNTYTATSSSAAATFVWTRAAVDGISNPAASGVGGTITEILINSSTGPVVVHYLIAPSVNGCQGTPLDLAVTVNPTAVITSEATANWCNNTENTYTATSSSTTATFAWTRAAVAGISNPDGSGTTAEIKETLINTTAEPVTVHYIITPSVNGCDGTPFDLSVTVNPPAVITSEATANWCNNTENTYTATSSSTTATFAWTRAAVAGISNPDGSGTTSEIKETLVNTTAEPVIVHYIITPSVNGCDGTPFDLSVTVNPTAVITSEATANWCNNTENTYTATSSSTTATFAWTRAAVAGISNPDGSGTTC